MDIFSAVGTVSIGCFNEGSHRIALIGTDFGYYDILTVPSNAPDSLFQWEITVINRQTGEVVPDFLLSIYLGEVPYDTVLADTTDASGFAQITYADSDDDSILYNLYAATWAHRGIPEVITLGIDEYWIEQ